jgi:cathepsin B
MFALAASYSLPEPLPSGVHPLRKQQVEEINKKTTLWKASPYRFASEAPGASKNQLGVKNDWNSEIQAKLLSGELSFYRPSKAIADMPNPTDFDSATNWPKCAKMIDNIRDQSNCGCCWAFGGAEAASDRMCIASDGAMNMPLSAQDVCFNSNFNGCGGGQITTPWSYIKRTGVVTGGLYNDTGSFGGGWCSKFSLPHCHHHGPTKDDPYPAEGAPGCPSERSPRGPKACDSDASADHSDFAGDKYTYDGNTETASGPTMIQKMIMEGGPVETAFTVYSDFEDYDSGIYHHTTGSYAGGHAVKIVGWGEEAGVQYWKVANSWNPYWGEKGYFRIRFGEGGIDSSVVGSPASASWRKMK